MKVLTIISSVLILQTSASFFDEFGGAVTTVESSFGKLLNDVIYDVKETIDCTLLAVEQVLSLGMFGDQSAYDRCKDAAVEQPVAVVESEPAPTEQEIFKNIPVLTTGENRQVGSSILNVDEILCDVLNKDNAHSQLESVKLTLQSETERLTEISELLRRQLEELSNEVKQKFKTTELQTSEPSVESIWNDIIILHEIEHRHRNTAEARKISHILDQILDILDANDESRTTEDEYKIKQIMSKLSKQSKDGSGKLWKNADDYPKDFREYANKIFKESQGSTISENSSEKPNSTTAEKEKPEEDEKKLNPDEVHKNEKPNSQDDNNHKNEKSNNKGDEVQKIEKLDNKNDEEKPKKDKNDNLNEATTVKPNIHKNEKPNNKDDDIHKNENLNNKDGDIHKNEKQNNKDDDNHKNEKPKNKGDKVQKNEKLNNKDDVEKPKKVKNENLNEATTVKPNQKKRKRTTTTTTENILSLEDIAAQYGSLFDVMPDVDGIDKNAESTFNIIEETKLNEMVMRSLDELESDAEDLW